MEGKWVILIPAAEAALINAQLYRVSHFISLGVAVHQWGKMNLTVWKVKFMKDEQIGRSVVPLEFAGTQENVKQLKEEFAALDLAGEVPAGDVQEIYNQKYRAKRLEFILRPMNQDFVVCAIVFHR